MRRVAVLVALAMGAMWTASASSAADRSFPLVLAQGSRLVIAGKINGHPVQALLDSAAEVTIIDKAWAQKLHLNQGQTVAGQGSGNASFEAQLVNGVTLEALDLRLKDQTVAIADLSDVGRRLLHSRVDVILGREVFDAARLLIDINGAHISVVSRDRQPPGTRVDLVSEHGVETVPVRIESGEPVRATFDLGNGSQILVGAALAKRMKLLTDGRKVTTQRGGGLGGEAERQVFLIRALEIAGRRYTNVEAAIDPNPSASDLNVGVSVLRHFRITTDFAKHAVWLDPRK